MRTSKGYYIYAAVARAREPGTITWILQSLEGRQKSGKASRWKEGRCLGNPDGMLLAGEAGCGLTGSGASFVMRERVWPSLIALELEGGKN